jgi:hypothetical protein
LHGLFIFKRFPISKKKNQKVTTSANQISTVGSPGNKILACLSALFLASHLELPSGSRTEVISRVPIYSQKVCMVYLYFMGTVFARKKIKYQLTTKPPRRPEAQPPQDKQKDK